MKFYIVNNFICSPLIKLNYHQKMAYNNIFYYQQLQTKLHYKVDIVKGIEMIIITLCRLMTNLSYKLA